MDKYIKAWKLRYLEFRLNWYLDRYEIIETRRLPDPSRYARLNRLQSRISLIRRRLREVRYG